MFKDVIELDNRQKLVADVLSLFEKYKYIWKITVALLSINTKVLSSGKSRVLN